MMSITPEVIAGAKLPWEVHSGTTPLGDTGDHVGWVEIRSGKDVTASWWSDEEGDAENAALIVAAVNALPELIALREENARMHSVLAGIASGAATFAGPQCCRDTFSDAVDLYADLARAALSALLTPEQKP